MERPVEAPRSEPLRPNSEFELRQEAETSRRLLEEQLQHQRQLQDHAVRTFTDFRKQDTYSAFDGQPDAEAKNALKDFLQSDTTARRINLAPWRFTTRPTLSELDDMLRISDEPLRNAMGQIDQ